MQWPGSVGATSLGEAIVGPWPSSSEARRPERGHCGDGLVALRPGRAPVEWFAGGIYGLRRGSTPPCNYRQLLAKPAPQTNHSSTQPHTGLVHQVMESYIQNTERLYYYIYTSPITELNTLRVDVQHGSMAAWSKHSLALDQRIPRNHEKKENV